MILVSFESVFLCTIHTNIQYCDNTMMGHTMMGGSSACGVHIMAVLSHNGAPNSAKTIEKLEKTKKKQRHGRKHVPKPFKTHKKTKKAKFSKTMGRGLAPLPIVSDFFGFFWFLNGFWTFFLLCLWFF